MKSSFNNKHFEAVVIGASAGGIQALKSILAHLPATFPLPIVIVLHIPEGQVSLLAEIFEPNIKMRVKEADEKEIIRPGTVYFSPPGYHLLIENNKTFSLTIEEAIHFSRPSIDVLFDSAAEVYGEHVVGILLTGANTDGAFGLKKIIERGGLCIIQNPATAEYSTMPASGIPYVTSEGILNLNEILLFLQDINKNTKSL
jgi:two-component system chemotaxis response regulator CheB